MARLPYDGLTERGQVLVMRRYAASFSISFGHPGASLRLLNHGYNTTFRLLSEGERFALRINVNSQKPPENMRGEVAWVSALRQEGLPVACPQPTLTGDWLVEASAPDVGLPLRAVLYSWLPGGEPYRRLTAEVSEKLGRLTSRLHDHGRRWRVPEGCSVPPFPGWLLGSGWAFDAAGYRGDEGVFRAAYARAEEALNLLQSTPPFPIHFDLHPGNLKLFRGELSVFDFDDMILGWPELDAAVTVFAIRRHPGAEEAYWRGLGAGKDTLQCDLEALVAGRAVMLANELFRIRNAELAAKSHAYGAYFEECLRGYLHTGRYDPDAAPRPK